MFNILFYRFFKDVLWGVLCVWIEIRFFEIVMVFSRVVVKDYWLFFCYLSFGDLGIVSFRLDDIG